jgi:ketosteroid isomerase-like protein
MLRTVLIGLALLPLAHPPLANAQEGDVAEVRALLESIPALVQAGDYAALDALWAPGRGVHIIEGAGVNHGWEDYRDNHLKPEFESFENTSFRYFAVEPQVRGDVAWASFRYELSADTGERQIAVEGRGTVILERMDGNWRIVQRHTSGRAKR